MCQLQCHFRLLHQEELLQKLVSVSVCAAYCVCAKPRFSELLLSLPLFPEGGVTEILNDGKIPVEMFDINQTEVFVQS